MSIKMSNGDGERQAWQQNTGEEATIRSLGFQVLALGYFHWVRGVMLVHEFSGIAIASSLIRLGSTHSDLVETGIAMKS